MRNAQFGTNLGELLVAAINGAAPVEKYHPRRASQLPTQARRKAEPKVAPLNWEEKDALLEIYRSGGSRMYHISYDARESLTKRGLLKGWTRLCSVWGIYELSRDGVLAAADLDE